LLDRNHVPLQRRSAHGGEVNRHVPILAALWNFYAVGLSTRDLDAVPRIGH
jgi:hypothetical protein